MKIHKKQLYVIIGIVLAITLVLGFEIFKGYKLKDNQLYTVDKGIEPEKEIRRLASSLNTRVPSRFYELKGINFDFSSGRIPLTLSPDGKSLYYMQPAVPKGKLPQSQIIKGATTRYMALVRLDIESAANTIIAPEIPMITAVKWSPDGSTAAFSGGGFLTLYDRAEKRVILKEQLLNENIMSIGWSPDSKKLYTGQTTLPNGSIVYVDSRKKLEPYEVKESIYLRQVMDNGYSYGMRQIIKAPSIASASSCAVVIVDNRGTVIKELGEGIFKDAYEKSLLMVDKRGFLLHLPDFNSPEKANQLTDKAVYDAQFAADGRIIYITASDNAEENSFVLHIADNNGLKKSNIEVSGSNILLHPDGKLAYVAGDKGEIVDIEKASLAYSTSPSLNAEKEAVFKVLRGGFNTIYRYILESEKNQTAPLKYFDADYASRNWLYIDSLKALSEQKLKELAPNQFWNTTLMEKDMKIYEEKGVKKADVKLEVTASTLWMEELKASFTVRLIHKNSSWLIYSIER